MGAIPRFDRMPEKELLKQNIHGAGAIIIDKFLDSIFVQDLRRDLFDLIDREKEDGRLMETDGSLRPRGVLNLMPSRFGLLKHLSYFSEHIIGSKPVLSSCSANVVRPGAIGQGVHRDYPYFAMPEFVPPTLMSVCSVQVIVALDDFRDDNGPTLIRPASHIENTWPNQEDFTRMAIPVTMSRGSILIFHGAVAHGVAPNKSYTSRAALLITFVPHWVRPLNDLITKADPQILADPEWQSLLGVDFKSRIRQDMSRKIGLRCLP